MMFVKELWLWLAWSDCPSGVLSLSWGSWAQILWLDGTCERYCHYQPYWVMAKSSSLLGPSNPD